MIFQYETIACYGIIIYLLIKTFAGLLKFMNNQFKIRLFSLLVLTFFITNFTLSISAQCGVYFKPNNWKLLGDERVSIAPITTPGYPQIEPVDLNGDGIKDLIGAFTTNGTTLVRRIKIVPSNDTGGFGNPFDIKFPTDVSFPQGLQPADFDLDGKKDLIVVLESNPISVVVYKNNGNGIFSPMSPSILSNFNFLQYVVDINNDGIGDLITGNAQFQSHYRLGNADGTFNAPVQLSAVPDLPPADFNNDGKIDLPYRVPAQPSIPINISVNQGNGIFFNQATNIFLSSSFTWIKLRDFNNDNLTDAAAADGNGNLSVFINLGNFNFARTDFTPPFASTNAGMFIGDFNGDGFSDIFIAQKNNNVSSFYSIFTNNGSGVFTRSDFSAPFRGFPIDDYDGDNKTDLVNIVDFNPNNTTFNVRIFNETQITVSKNVCNKQGQTKIVDFDNNGRTNTVLFRPSDGRWRYLPYEGAFVNEVNFYWGLPSDLTTPGDFDGDGRTDFAVYRPSNSVWYIRNSSDGSFNFVQFGLSDDKPVAADYDGDGKTDIAVYRPSEGNWYVYNSGNGQVYIAHFGIAEDKAVPEDYDGDGKADLAVFRPSTRVWYILKTSDGNFTALQWGLGSDIPVPADYDGDGKADITVFRPSDGDWYIIRSYNQQYAFFHFGATGDIPQPGDWNGDGIIDIGVYRPSNFTWYSSTYSSSAIYGTAGEMPIATIIRVQ